MINVEELSIDLDYWQGEEANRLHALKLLLAGYSNQSIAQELNFSLKNIESIVAKLFRRCGIITRGSRSYLINPRVKLMVHGLRNNWLRYEFGDESRNKMRLLSRHQYLTIQTCAAGFSNRGISEFLVISPKTVESRLNSLFNQFDIDDVADKRQANPRMGLLVNALKQEVLNPYAITVASELLNADEWQGVLENAEQIQETFLRLQLEQGRPYMLQPGSSVSELLERINTTGTLYSRQSSEQKPINQEATRILESKNWG